MIGPRLWLLFEGPLVFVVLLVIGLVVLPVVSVGLIFAAEALLLLLLLPFVVAGRILFGAAWWVEVRRGFAPFWEEEAGSWRQSRERIRTLAAAIAAGDPPLRSLGGPDPESEVAENDG